MEIWKSEIFQITSVTEHGYWIFKIRCHILVTVGLHRNLTLLLNYCTTHPRGPLESVPLWHMPHGIILRNSSRNNDSCYLLFEQPFSSHFHATPCVSSYLWFLFHDLLAFTKSSHCHFSPRSKELTHLLALLLISIRYAFLTTYASLPSHLSENSHHEYFKLSHTHQIILELWRFLFQRWNFSYE